MAMLTQVGIVGGGPAGLLLSHLLHLNGVESIIVEARSRQYVEERVRAGVLEQGTADLMIETGVGERLKREGLPHYGVKFRFAGQTHRFDFKELANGRAIFVYPQNKVVADLFDARLAAGGRIFFEAEDVSVLDFSDATPQKRAKIRFCAKGRAQEIECDFIAGCDGFHGVCRPSIPDGVLTEFSREYPFGWLGILSETPPVSPELVYAQHERGFALCSMRNPTLSRYYVQCNLDDDVTAWPDARFWDELRARLPEGTGERLVTGRSIEKSITPLRSFIAEPMQYGRLFLAGDAAHIVPPTGAKGLNLAIADVARLAPALAALLRDGDHALADAYSDAAQRRVWRCTHFSWWMTTMLHRYGDDFDVQLQLAQLRWVVSSRAGAQGLSENYAGLPLNS